MVRGRAPNLTLPLTRALSQQREYRARKAAKLNNLEHENEVLREEIEGLKRQLGHRHGHCSDPPEPPDTPDDEGDDPKGRVHESSSSRHREEEHSESASGKLKRKRPKLETGTNHYSVSREDEFIEALWQRKRDADAKLEALKNGQFMKGSVRIEELIALKDNFESALAIVISLLREGAKESDPPLKLELDDVKIPNNGFSRSSRKSDATCLPPLRREDGETGLVSGIGTASSSSHSTSNSQARIVTGLAACAPHNDPRNTGIATNSESSHDHRRFSSPLSRLAQDPTEPTSHIQGHVPTPISSAPDPSTSRPSGSPMTHRAQPQGPLSQSTHQPEDSLAHLRKLHNDPHPFSGNPMSPRAGRFPPIILPNPLTAHRLSDSAVDLRPQSRDRLQEYHDNPSKSSPLQPLPKLSSLNGVQPVDDGFSSAPAGDCCMGVVNCDGLPNNVRESLHQMTTDFVRHSGASHLRSTTILTSAAGPLSKSPLPEFVKTPNVTAFAPPTTDPLRFGFSSDCGPDTSSATVSSQSKSSNSAENGQGAGQSCCDPRPAMPNHPQADPNNMAPETGESAVRTMPSTHQPLDQVNTANEEECCWGIVSCDGPVAP